MNALNHLTIACYLLSLLGFLFTIMVQASILRAASWADPATGRKWAFPLFNSCVCFAVLSHLVQRIYGWNDVLDFAASVAMLSAAGIAVLTYLGFNFNFKRGV